MEKSTGVFWMYQKVLAGARISVLNPVPINCMQIVSTLTPSRQFPGVKITKQILEQHTTACIEGNGREEVIVRKIKLSPHGNKIKINNLCVNSVWGNGSQAMRTLAWTAQMPVESRGRRCGPPCASCCYQQRAQNGKWATRSMHGSVQMCKHVCVWHICVHVSRQLSS